MRSHIMIERLSAFGYNDHTLMLRSREELERIYQRAEPGMREHPEKFGRIIRRQRRRAKMVDALISHEKACYEWSKRWNRPEPIKVPPRPDPVPFGIIELFTAAAYLISVESSLKSVRTRRAS